MNNFRVARSCYTALSVVANLSTLVTCLPFRRVSIKHVVLLAAMIGAVVLARRAVKRTWEKE